MNASALPFLMIWISNVASLFGCGVITGFGAVLRVGKVQPGERVAVVGIGGVGVNALQAARIAGAGEIHAIDTDIKKRVLRLGATDFINPKKARLKAAHRWLLLLSAFVAVGSSKRDQPPSNDPGGRVVIMGMPSDDDLVSIDAVRFRRSAKSVIGTKMGSAMIREDIPQLIKWYQQGELNLDRLISHRFPLRRLMKHRFASTARVVINFAHVVPQLQGRPCDETRHD